MATLALLSIVTIPLSVELLAAYFRSPLTMPASAIARLAFISVLLPLVAGIAVRTWTTAAERLVRPASLLGMLLLVIGSVLLLSAAWRGIWSVVGDGTVAMVAAFMAIGLVVGRFLGGPDARQATVLGLPSRCRSRQRTSRTNGSGPPWCCTCSSGWCCWRRTSCGAGHASPPLKIRPSLRHEPITTRVVRNGRE
jgi:hypothetical protein